MQKDQADQLTVGSPSIRVSLINPSVVGSSTVHNDELSALQVNRLRGALAPSRILMPRGRAATTMRPLVTGCFQHYDAFVMPTKPALIHRYHDSYPRNFTNARTFSTSPLETSDLDTENVDASINNKPIRILFGSQGGTAQIFSMQLADALDDETSLEVETMGLAGIQSQSSHRLSVPTISMSFSVRSRASVNLPTMPGNFTIGS